MNGEFRIEYVELPNGRIPARELIDSLDDKAAARIDAFIDRLRVYGNRMQGKFVKKLSDNIFELRVKQFESDFSDSLLLSAGRGNRHHIRLSEKAEQTPPNEIVKAEKLRRIWMKYRNRYTGSKAETDTILRELGL